MIEPNDKKEIRKMFSLSSTREFNKRIGDTPTDNLQLVPKKYLVSYVSSTIGGIKATYAGSVNSGGTAIALPAGWSSVKNSTGDYSVTHNLGITAYIAVACIGVGVRFLAVSAQTSTRFDINTYDNTNTLADGPFQFTLTLT